MKKRYSARQSSLARDEAARARRLRTLKEASTDLSKPNPYARLMAKFDTENTSQTR